MSDSNSERSWYASPDLIPSSVIRDAVVRRRRILEYLRNSSPASVDEIAKALRTDGERASERDLQTTLHHVDLPTLQNADLIVYDSDRTRAKLVD